MIHGFSGSGRSWGDGLLEALSRRFRVVAVDLLGHGMSDRPHDPVRYGLGRLSDDLGRVVDSCFDGPVDLVGYSMGARLALGVACGRPAWLRRLVLESGSPGLHDPEARRARVESDEALAGRMEAEGIEAFLSVWEGLAVFDSMRGSVSARTWAAVTAQRRDNDPLALAAVLRGFGTGAQPSLWDALPAVACPALLLSGRQDPKFRDLGRRMASLMPQGRAVSVPGAGHRVHLERPRHWVRVVRAFLAKSVA